MWLVSDTVRLQKKYSARGVEERGEYEGGSQWMRLYTIFTNIYFMYMHICMYIIIYVNYAKCFLVSIIMHAKFLYLIN